MTIPTAQHDTHKLPPIKRAAYNFKGLSRAVLRRDGGEPLVNEATIIAAGIHVDPFWNTPGNIEGDLQRDYIAAHTEFSLSVRVSVLKRLQQAQQLLPNHWQLTVKAGHRPYEVQLRLLDYVAKDAGIRHPDWNAAQRLEHARTFVADPRLGCPPHTTGGAVDVDVIDTHTNAPVDMGCPPNTDDEISFLFSKEVSREQHDNRMVLLQAMLDAGFAPLAAEWWHYQYGETTWAAFYGHAETLYDVIPDKNV